MGFPWSTSSGAIIIASLMKRASHWSLYSSKVSNLLEGCHSLLDRIPRPSFLFFFSFFLFSFFCGFFGDRNGKT